MKSRLQTRLTQNGWKETEWHNAWIFSRPLLIVVQNLYNIDHFQKQMAWNTHLFSLIMGFCCCRFQSRIARRTFQDATEMNQKQKRQTQSSSQNQAGSDLRASARLHFHLCATTSALITWFRSLHFWVPWFETFDSSDWLESSESVHQNDSLIHSRLRSVVLSAAVVFVVLFFIHFHEYTSNMSKHNH